MLYIVQVVMWGVAEAPRAFTDEAKARTAFVETAKAKWEQRYAAYCEHHRLSRDEFGSAQGFVKTLDVSEKSTVNLWSLSLEEAGVGETGPGVGSEQFHLLAKEVVAVKEGLARLLGDVSKLVEGFLEPAAAQAGVQAAETPQETSTAPSAAPLDKPESDPAKYGTKEWGTFVGQVRQMFSGSRNECYLLPRDMWRHDVYGNFTTLEYWDWVADRMELYRKKAENAGYNVVTDHDSADYLRFTNAEGAASEENYDSEWEAWCAAGLHLETA